MKIVRALVVAEDPPAPGDLDGSRSLLVAMLLRAIKDLKSKDSTIRREAKEWFTANSKDEWGYRWTLDTLGFAPSMVRAVEVAVRANAWGYPRFQYRQACK